MSFARNLGFFFLPTPACSAYGAHPIFGAKNATIDLTRGFGTVCIGLAGLT